MKKTGEKTQLIRLPGAGPRRALAAALLLVLVTPVVVAQPGRGADKIRVQAYTFQHQPASEALSLVRPLLSPAGTVELQPGGNTLVIRDVQRVIDGVLLELRKFDHLPHPLKLEIQLLEASKKPPVTADSPELPAWLVKRLGELLRYNSYRLLGQAGLITREGEDVNYRLGRDFLVDFTVGTVMEDKRLKLLRFKVVKRDDAARQQLFYGHLSLWLDQTLTLVLARQESSDTSLVVAVTCNQSD